MSRVGLILRDYGVYLVDSATMNVMNITPYQQLLLYVPHTRGLVYDVKEHSKQRGCSSACTVSTVVVQFTIYNLTNSMPII